MDPFTLSTGGGGLSGGSSGASGSYTGGPASFGGYGTTSYNFGGGSISSGPNWYLIAGLAVAALFAIKMLKK